MINCPHCGAPSDDSQSFCSLCGQPLTASSYNPSGRASTTYRESYSDNARDYSSKYTGETKKIYIMCREHKEPRLFNYNEEREFSNSTTYRTLFGGTVLLGLIINLLICLFVEQNIDSVIEFLGDFGYIISLVSYVIICIVSAIITFTSTNPLTNFILYNLVVFPIGFLLSVGACIDKISPSIITNAVLVSLAIVVVLTIIFIIIPRLFDSVSASLIVTLLVTVAISVVNAMFIKNCTIKSSIGVGIFSLYVGYHFYCAEQFPRTKGNAIACALDIYLDLFHLLLDGAIYSMQERGKYFC